MIINYGTSFGFFLLIFMHCALGIIWEDEDTVIIEAEIGASEGVRWKRQFPGFPVNWPIGGGGGGIFGGGIFTYPKPTVAPAGPSGGSTCTTNNGFVGECKNVRQCYPFLFYSADERNLTAIRNIPLYDAYQTSSGFCRSSSMINQLYYSGDTDMFARQNNMICCPTKKPATSPISVQGPIIQRTTTMRPSWTHRPGTGGVGGPGGHRPPSRRTTARTTTSTTYRPPQPTTPSWGRPPSTSAPATTTKSPLAESSCGHPLIVGGSEAVPGQYPWIISMVVDQKHLCGGSLIDSRHVLTAAHCIAFARTGYEVAKIIILLGDHDLSTTSEARHVVRKVKRIAKHSGFRDEQVLHNDIAIIELDQDVPFQPHIKPICLFSGSTRYDTGNVMGTVVGWGSTQYNTNTVTRLRHVDMRLWTNQECAAKYGHLAKGGITEGQVCAASPGKDSCRGDSGGPLMIKNGGHFEQIGIVSWGIECGTYPGVYTRVDKYRQWIEKNRHR